MNRLTPPRPFLVVQVYAQLKVTPHSGAKFAEAVRKLLARETAWVAWKAGGAPSFERPPAQVAAPSELPPPPPSRDRFSPSRYRGRIGAVVTVPDHRQEAAMQASNWACAQPV